MTARAVISCPMCLRQYTFDTRTESRLGQCAACKSTFEISLATLANGEAPVVLTDPLVYSFTFFQEGCAEMVRNATDLLALAGRQATASEITAIVSTIPQFKLDLDCKEWQQGSCFTTLLAAEFRVGDHGRQAERFRELTEYFLYRLPERSLAALAMLQAAFLGVLTYAAREDVRKARRSSPRAWATAMSSALFRAWPGRRPNRPLGRCHAIQERTPREPVASGE
jgi:hypothetical protein